MTEEFGGVHTIERRNQRIGRRELDLWREHQIARAEQLVTALNALVVRMQNANRMHGAEFEYNVSPRTCADWLAAELAKHRGPR
jgi:hypothetical protein